MKILLLSYVFPPSVGGIEIMSSILAAGLAERGHDLTVVTHTPVPHAQNIQPFTIRSRPSGLQLMKAIHWADVILQSNSSLRLSWPLYAIFLRKPFVLVHHTPITRPDGSKTLLDIFKQLAASRALCYSVSHYLAGTLRKPSQVIPNTYRQDIFFDSRSQKRNNSLLFVGRLVFAKGVDVLLRALHSIVHRGNTVPELTIVGSGPEELRLRRLVVELNLSGQVQFVGTKTQEEIAVYMNRASVVVIPSRSHPPEAFPLVPLEALACGCVVVASDSGGLPEAVGPCGLLFETGAAVPLASCLERVLCDASLGDLLLSRVPQHLSRFKTRAVIDVYEQLLNFAAAPTPRDITVSGGLTPPPC